VDWPTVGNTFRSKVSDATTDEELAAIFIEMIRPLGDAHTSIFVGETQVYGGLRTGSAISSGEEFAPLGERFAAAEQEYLSVDLMTWGDEYIAYGDLSDGLGYLRMAGFSGFSESGSAIDDEAELTRALEEIFTADRVAKLKGLIIDVRWNGGGSDELALQLAGRLSDTTYVAYAKQARKDPSDPKIFTKPQSFSVEPASGPEFTGPITVLTSSLTFSAGETFTQAMLGRTPAPIRIGGNTQGIFSDVLRRNLPGSTVVFGLPNEEFITAQGFSFDGLGVPPDICVPTFNEADLAAAKDPAMDAARKLLLGGVAPTPVDITKAPASVC
jgi:C-terminal processing protease CtpA/Prc